MTPTINNHLIPMGRLKWIMNCFSRIDFNAFDVNKQYDCHCLTWSQVEYLVDHHLISAQAQNKAARESLPKKKNA